MTAIITILVCVCVCSFFIVFVVSVILISKAYIILIFFFVLFYLTRVWINLVFFLAIVGFSINFVRAGRLIWKICFNNFLCVSCECVFCITTYFHRRKIVFLIKMISILREAYLHFIELSRSNRHVYVPTNWLCIYKYISTNMAFGLVFPYK